MSVIDQNQCSKMTLSVIIVISALAIFSAGECAWSDAQYLVPKGGIILWSGTENRIPKGWVVCDGTHGSPDLRDRFVIGSGGGATNKPFSSGGLASVTPSVTVQDTALTEAQMPNHNHGSETEIEDNENIYYDARSVPEWYVSTSENYKIRAVLSSGNETCVFSSNTHNHSIRAQTTRAPSPVREIVLKSAAAKLSQTQIRLAVANEYNGQVSSSKVTSLLKYQRLLTLANVYSVHDFYQWCQLRSTTLSLQSPHDVYVPQFEINSSEDLFVFFATRQLISVGAQSYLHQVDATFKLTWQELPLLVFGCSDTDRHFHPYGIALISTDEAASSYARLFQTLKQTVLNTTGLNLLNI
ncbi:unnamed protein product [Didymodactylos carnosus]|uniref:Uncharacterized protein n=1 Tax=Didymodactylos carnosus TaxID=1234261 RepID=A0A8S2IFB1_9BILA|nr:unnamed protein product [Didymodactylos carnosus]CAF3727159.1 unnamed protein product [Didymodactylos carnosus]